eukprot:TRINITY_DN4030_c0_g1_i1.p1 TRINITY_DN4030_c0_g1~~TRINITY_DN4030_c0_g1_i1.p1  ORF type:complete len:495 (-),score=136.35 TRINITY_DN4030_c0_g1_i1:48-1451(-)
MASADAEAPAQAAAMASADAEAPAQAAASPAAPAKSSSELPPEEKQELHGCAHVLYYTVIFFAAWFGSDRFDMDGDGDFDPADVQCFLAENGILGKQYLQTPEQKAAAKKRGSIKRKKEAERKKNDKDAGALDRDGDGDVDIDDMMFNEVEGEAQEDIAMKNLTSGKTKPFFIIFEILVTCTFWGIGAIFYAQEHGKNYLTSKGGLDTIFPDQTNLLLATSDCDDLRPQVWRWLSYQFTHVGITHIGMNTLLNIILGLPLEAMHGWWRLAIMFNVGVFGGAACYFVADAHISVVGCSGGCYSLIGIHAADLIINWHQKRFRLPTIVLLLALVGSDLLTYNLSEPGKKSNAAHFGGAVAGFCIGILFCDNQTVKDYEKVIMGIVFLIGAALTIFTITWMATRTDGPQNIFEGKGWCWVRVTLDPRVNGAAWECIRCGTQECIASYVDGGYKLKGVAMSYCNNRGFFGE